MSQRNSRVDPKPGQLELTKGSPRWMSQESLTGDFKPGRILVESEGSKK